MEAITVSKRSGENDKSLKKSFELRKVRLREKEENAEMIDQQQKQ